jgi:hypothetical protein
MSMTISCRDRERIFLDGAPEEWAALESHCTGCAACAEELRAWKNLSLAASELHQEWDSPWLWPRIEQALAQQSGRTNSSRWPRFFGSWNLRAVQWQTAAAALLLAALTASSIIWFTTNLHLRRHTTPDNQALLNDRAVYDVERAEAAYGRAIDKLDAQARPQLQNSSAPLMANYREKLLVLDSAIADLKSQASINPANGHLRRELLAMYREKQDTLEQLLEVK